MRPRVSQTGHFCLLYLLCSVAWREGHSCARSQGQAVHLIAQYFRLEFKDPVRPLVVELHRVREMEEAFRLNLEHPSVAAVHVLTETRRDYDYVVTLGDLFDRCRKLRIFHIGMRARYKEYARHATQHLKGQVVVMLHADISLGTGWEHLRKEKLQGAVYALSRYEYPDQAIKCSSEYRGSHDAFIFVAPLPNEAIMDMEFREDELGSENTMIRILQLYDLPVINPCRVLKVVHHHESQLRLGSVAPTGRNLTDQIYYYNSCGFAVPTSSFDVAAPDNPHLGYLFSQQPGTEPQGAHPPSSLFGFGLPHQFGM